MKKGARGQHLIDTGEWILGFLDEGVQEELKEETDDQIMERIKCEEDFLEEEYVEYQDENQRDEVDREIFDSIVNLSYCVNLLEEREALRVLDILANSKGVEIKDDKLVYKNHSKGKL